MNTPYEAAAIAYATGASPIGMPVPVFPVDALTKKPLVKWGTEVATTADEVVALWARFPDARVGLKLQTSPLVVLDIEGPGHGCDLAEVIQDIEDRVGPLPPTLTAVTEGGGRHLYFLLPNGMSPDEFAETIADPVSGQEIRGTEVKRGSLTNNGRYVLAPAAFDGSTYDGRAWEDLSEVAPMPPFLLPAVTKRQIDVGPCAPARESLFRDGEVGTKSGVRALEGISRAVAEAQEGNVNNALHWGACRAGEYVASGHLDKARAEQALFDAAIIAGHGLTNGRQDPAQHRAIQATISSGLEKGLASPRDPAEVGAPDDYAPARDRVAEWTPMSPLIAIRNRAMTPEPALLQGTDGTALIYPGARVLISGEPEAGKSWAALIAATEVITQGGRVLYVDSDAMGPAALLDRLRLLGLSDGDIDRGCEWTNAEGLDGPGELASLKEYAIDGEFTLVVIDTWDPLLELCGLDSMSNGDVNTFSRILLTPLHSAEITTLICDHVVKNKDNRGRYSAGAGAKLRPMEQHLSFVIRGDSMINRDADGELTIKIQKDRPGALARKSEYKIALRHEPPRRIAYDVYLAENRAMAPRFRPTGLMEAVSLAIEAADQAAGGIGQSRHSKASLERDVYGTARYIRQAIDVLIDDGYVAQGKPLQGKTLYLVRAYREAGDTKSDEATGQTGIAADAGPVDHSVGSPEPPRGRPHTAEHVGAPSDEKAHLQKVVSAPVEPVDNASPLDWDDTRSRTITDHVGGSSPPMGGEPTGSVAEVPVYENKPRELASAPTSDSYSGLNPLTRRMVERMSVELERGEPYDKIHMERLLAVTDGDRPAFEVAWNALLGEGR